MVLMPIMPIGGEYMLTFFLSLITILSFKRKQNYTINLIRRILVSANIALLVLLTMVYGIRFFKPEPRPPYDVTWELENKLKKLEKEGIEEKIAAIKEKIAVAKKEYNEKSVHYEKDMEEYIRRRLIIALIIGITLIILGIFLVAPVFGAGSIVAGALCISNGVSFYWEKWGDLTRFLVVIGAIVLLLIVGYFLRLRYARQK